MPYTLPAVSQLKDLSEAERTDLLNNLFEPHPTIITYLSPLLFNNHTVQNFKSFDDLIEEARVQLLKLSPTAKQTQEIISSHPRLGVPKTVKLSEHSNNEQRNLQADSPETIARFVKLNNDYELKYPGLRFVVFVNGRTRDEIAVVFEERINNSDYESEVKYALNAMCDIANDRVKKLQAASSHRL